MEARTWTKIKTMESSLVSVADSFLERYKRLLKYILKGLRQTEAEKETME